MRWRWILGLFLGHIISYSNAQFTAVLINNNASTVSPADIPVTGKLSQFKGFHTPRPFPPNANFMYASIWASWSAWSFCAGKVQVRVRACNTVRGYSCPGPNKETKPCDIPPPRQDDGNGQKANVDYDVHDPYSATAWDVDRREALKQLYSDYDMSPEVKQKAPNTEFRRQLSAGKTPVRNENLQGPPVKSFGRDGQVNNNGGAHAPSMTPELLYERKPFVDNDIPKKTVAFASKNTKETSHIVDTNIPPHDGDVGLKASTIPTTKEPTLIDKDVKSKPLNNKLRDNQSVSSSVLVDANPRSNEWNSGPSNKPPRLSNRQPFTRPVLNPSNTKSQQFSQTTSRLFTPIVTQSIPTTTTQKPSTGRGDEVKISSSVQQHFKNPQSSGGISSSISELKLRDANVTESPSPVQAQIKEEPLSTALESNQPNSSDAGQESQKTLDKDSNLISPSTRAVIARRPTEEEVEKMANRFDNGRLSGEAGQLKTNLHSGEIVYNKLPNMNDETAKALDWLLKNMTQATDTQPTKMHNLNLDGAPRSSEVLSPPTKINNSRRLFASKILPEGRLSRNGQPSKSLISNPDEEEKQLESELSALKESMKQMESELKDLRDAESTPQRPRFNVQKAINLNLVPNTPRQQTLKVHEEPRIFEKPSELFLLDHYQHQSNAHWSEWGSYGECFCNKRIRTRNCNYDDPAHSEGCEGKSYESIRCVGGRPCPNERKHLTINRRTSTINHPKQPSTIAGHFSTSRYYTLTSTLQTTEQPPHGDLFYPNPLPMSKRQF